MSIFENLIRCKMDWVYSLFILLIPMYLNVIFDVIRFNIVFPPIVAHPM